MGFASSYYYSYLELLIFGMIPGAPGKKTGTPNEKILDYLEGRYQGLLKSFSVAYATSSQWYVGGTITPYLYNYFMLPNLFFGSNVLDELIDEWVMEYEVSYE